MANNAIINIKVNTLFLVDTQISVSTEGRLNADEKAKSVRSNIGEFSNNVNIPTVVQNIVDAYTSDYGDKFDCYVSSSDTVTIEGFDPFQSFFDISVPDNCTFEYIPNVEPPPSFYIESISAQAADSEDRNTYYRANINVDNGVSPYEITSPISKIAPSESDLYYDYERQPSLSIDTSVTDNNNDVATITTPTVDLFTISNIDILDNLSGSTVSVILDIITGDISTNREFSLDQSQWRVSNIFTGILPGDYTMYVRDDLGALLSQEFTVVGSEKTLAPEFDIPKANGLRFVPQFTPSCSLPVNWDNTLFAELFKEGAFPNVDKGFYYQKIAECDTIPTQINTNYDNIEVKLIDCDGIEIILPITLISDNLNKKDKRDVVFVQASDGNAVIYWGGGNVYEPDTTTVIPPAYTNTTGGLPFFAKLNVAKFFSISNSSNYNGDYEGIEEYYDVDNAVNGIKIAATYVNTGGGICQTLYDDQTYNSYTFDLTGASLDTNKTYTIEVTVTDPDPNYDDQTWVSEPIKKVSHLNTTLIDSAHKGDIAGLDFTSGMRTIIRVPSRYINANNAEEATDFDAENGKRVTQKVIIKRLLSLETGYIPFYLAEKIAYASGFSDLKLNGVSYSRGEDYEQESKLEERNPFVEVTRNYQSNDVISIGEDTGIVTQTKQVIGTGGNVVIGDNA